MALATALGGAAFYSLVPTLVSGPGAIAAVFAAAGFVFPALDDAALGLLVAADRAPR